MTADNPPDRDLKTTFDASAELYHRARPRYPDALIDEVCAAMGGPSVAHVLEVGPASGVATEQLAERGLQIAAVELGADLAAVARGALGRFPHVDVVTASFDEWEPPEWGGFDGVVAATSWHWLDPGSKYQRAHRHLRPGGVLAFWAASHVFPDGGDDFFRDIQDVYDDIYGSSEGQALTRPRPGELPDRSDEIEASGLFDVVSVSHHDWVISYTADEYIDLLNTFSGHIAMQPNDRVRLYGEIRDRLAARSDGMCHRGWGAVLHIARARP